MSEWDQFDSADEWDTAFGPKVGIAKDVAKSAGIGLVKGAINLAGLPGDAASLAGSGASWLAGKAGLSEGGQEIAGGIANRLASAVMPFGISPPKSQEIKKSVEGVTGEFYKPQTTAGEYAQTVGEFVPGLVGGAGGLLRKAVTNVVAPALTSETAGQVTKGTQAEPYARVAGALLGGGGTSKLLQPRATAAPKIEEALDAASAGYKSPEVKGVAFTPVAIQSLGKKIARDLNTARFDANRAPLTHGVLDDLKAPPKQMPNSQSVTTVQSLDEARQVLGKIAGDFKSPLEQAAASNAIGKIDRFLGNVQQKDLLWGDAAAANTKLTEARGNYASAKAAERVQNKLSGAELQAGSSYSGGNINNATRQKLRTLLTGSSPEATRKAQRGFTEDELAVIDQAVRGSFAGNALRVGGKMLGGGGGMHAFGSAAAGGMAMGFPGLATPLAGYTLKKAGDYLTRRKSDQILQTILARSPLGVSRGAGQIAPHTTPLQASLISGILGLPQLRQ